ncbi:MAG: protease inhibitor I42 family protein [Methanoculleus sp.]|jgi:inhibitor of cysteine peptidase|uniref:protease inhibitor I42 family protein n=1 Tax=Methanoculleus nereidis TaxID=2735141 RepID=UPI0026BEA9CD|nr:protease inhibitor I42 family protein [Methanoculleus sp. YWC-01]MCK9297415.1 protease inhibitor I42 family protein [Methanoculleus sp.]
MVQKKSIYGVLIAGLLVLCLLGAGCTSQPAEEGTPTPTPVETTAAPTATSTPAPAEEYAFNETNNNETVTVPVGSEITISLDENPTTGYEWNVTSSAGLEYVNDTFIAPETGLVGAGGVHVWEYTAAEEGSGEFSAIYKRSWEETIGNETTFSMAFVIE